MVSAATSGNRRCPWRVLRLAVDLAHEIREEPLESDRVALEESPVVQVLRHQRVREREQERRVRAGAGGDPVRGEEVGGIVPERADVDELHARLATRLKRAMHAVLGVAAVIDLGVLQRHPAEQDEQPGVRGDYRPRGDAAHQAQEIAHDMGHDDLGRTVAVAVDGRGEAAEEVEKTMELGRRVVEASGAGPAVTPGKDRRVAEVALDALEFGGDEIERALPGDRHERLGTAAATAGTALEIAGAHHRLGDARLVVDRAGKRGHDRRGMGIRGERLDVDKPAVFDDRAQRPPMRRTRPPHGRGGA